MQTELNQCAYRSCPRCGELFAPITSDANDRYKYCSPDCEQDAEDALECEDGD